MDRSSAHPSGPELLEFLLAADEPARSERTREHLLTGCVRCLRELRQRAAAARETERRDLAGLPGPGRPEAGPARAQRVSAVAERRVLLVEAERRAAPGLLRELLLLGPAARREAIRTRGRFRFYGLAEHLTAEGRRLCFEDVARAVELGELAAELADALPPGAYPPGLVADARALAWGALGNARRVLGELVEAERSLGVAEGVLVEGSGDGSVRAEVLSLVGSLRTDQARFDEAVVALREAAELHRAYGHRAEEGKVLMQLGNAAGESGDVAAASRYSGQARELLVRESRGELPALAAIALVEWTRAAGRIEEARRVWDELQEETRGRELTFFLRQRVAWAGARLAWSEGDLGRAEEVLREVREGYGESGEAYRFCLISLDLARLCLEQGRTPEVRELAREMVPVFACRQIHHHALQALALFQRAAEAETATIALVRDLARYLRHAANNPYLAYPAAGEP